MILQSLKNDKSVHTSGHIRSRKLLSNPGNLLAFLGVTRRDGRSKCMDSTHFKELVAATAMSYEEGSMDVLCNMFNGCSQIASYRRSSSRSFGYASKQKNDARILFCSHKLI
jgi:hypothetical protein